MFNKILVPLDGGEMTEGILPFISHLAQRLGSDITLMTVIDPGRIQTPPMRGARHESTEEYRIGMAPTNPTLGVTTRAVKSRGPYISQLLERAKRAAGDRLATLAQEMAADGGEHPIHTKIDTEVLLGNNADEIVRFANNEGFGLIAMATHGRSTLG